MRKLAGLAVAMLLVAGAGWGQEPGPDEMPAKAPVKAAQAAQPAAAKGGCAVQHFLANDANVALAEKHYQKAADLYLAQLEKNPESTAAKAGLVRAEAGARHLDEALKLATEYVAKAPDDALLNDALGEVRFRRGEIAEAATAFNKAMHADPCVARTHFDVARYQMLAGNFLTAAKQVDLAHRLAPEEQEITTLYDQVHAKKRTPEEQIAVMTKHMNREDTPEDQKKRIAGRIATLKAHGKGSCTMDEPVETAKIPLLPVLEQNKSFRAVTLEMEFDGNKRRLVLDTGASGLLISKSVADKLGLTPEAELRIGGIGEGGAQKGYLAHVDTLKLGGMVFHQCEVQVMAERSGEADGLVGTDVFGRWLVTVDVPVRELRLGPLPARPGDDAAKAAPLALETEGAEGGDADWADPKDRYVAPEMESWTKIYRQGHDLIFPTRVNDQPLKLFLMDTGATNGSLATPVAKQVGNLVPVNTVVTGISGQVQEVFTVDKQVTLDFAGVQQLVRGITVMDMSGISRGQGFELSGLIGFTTLRELTISIDYRDDLVKVVFDPKHGFHSNGRLEY